MSNATSDGQPEAAAGKASAASATAAASVADASVAAERAAAEPTGNDKVAATEAPEAGPPTEVIDNADAGEPEDRASQDAEADVADAETEELAADDEFDADDYYLEADELAEPDELTEPTQLIQMSEPVDLAEPVDPVEPTGRVRGRRGRGLLLAAGFVLAALAIIGGAIAIVGSVTHGFKKPVKVTYKKSAIFSLRTGECVDASGQSATIVSCGTPHQAEVFATFTLPSGKWPGDSAVRAVANAGCSSRLNGYINPQLTISLSSTYVFPDSVAWQAGTRTVICEVQATSGQLDGSVRDATASTVPAGG